MVKRVVLKSIFVQRDGQQQRLEVGKEFDFTAEELADIKRMKPGAIRIKSDEFSDDELTQQNAEAVAKAAADKDAKEKADRKAAADKKAADDKAAAEKKAADKKAADEKRAADVKAGKTNADDL